ncbi:MAG: hypothetical protein ACK4JF_04460 [Methylohalobius sp.]
MVEKVKDHLASREESEFKPRFAFYNSKGFKEDEILIYQDQLARGGQCEVYFVFTGLICDPEKGEFLRSELKNVPLDRLLIASDSPFSTPQVNQLD